MNAILQARVTAFTHNGLVRSHNEDTIAVGAWIQSTPMDAPRQTVHGLDRALLCLVADGMGGHAAGEEASRLAAVRMAESAHSAATEADVAVLVRRANREIFAAMRENPRRLGMGTTVAGVLVRSDSILWFNVGDSCLFRYHDQILRQLSIDDVPDPHVPHGFRSHIVTQALGGAPSLVDVTPHTGEEPAAAGRRYLLCSDGLTDMVDPVAIKAAFVGDDVAAVAKLFNMAMIAGGADNVSIVLLRLEEASGGQTGQARECT
jgi:serine/threonine protein phosphatase PrpC